MGSHTNAPSQRVQDAAVTSVLDSIRRVVRMLRVASRSLEKEFGLSAAQLFVLHALAEAPVASLNDLARLTRTHQSSVSVVVQRLVERGLVARERAAGDARRMGLSLTPAAHKLLRAAPDAPSELLISALERMPAGARRRLARSLERLVNDLGVSDEPAPMLFEDEGAAPTAPRPRRGKGGVSGATARPSPGATKRRRRRPPESSRAEGGA